MNSDLFLAILAMDAYNQGYDRGIVFGDGSGHTIGVASYSTQTDVLPGEPGVEESFYAVSYILTSAIGGAGTGSDLLASGSKIISFRGTNDISLNFSPTDLDDWLGGAGWQTGQGELAADFYRSVVNTNANAQNLYNANVTLTGHSLGGGLAALLASLYGKKAVIFDNMAFGGAAQNLYHHATTPTIGVTAGTETYTEPNPFHQPALDIYYGSASPLAVNSSGVTGYQVDGQALELLGITVTPHLSVGFKASRYSTL